MKLLKDMVIDFCLFSLIEGYIYCYFFEKVGGFKKFRWYEIFILSAGNCFISQIFPPLIYQIMMILWMSIYLFKLNKNKKCFLYPICAVTFMLIIEMNIFFIYEYFFKIDLSSININDLFFNSIILKTIEFILIKIYYNYKRRK